MYSTILKYYNEYDEEGRLFRDNAHTIEWRTTMHYFNMLIPANSYIYDGCAGTGNYAFELASMGHKVVAGDIVPQNVEVMKQKQIVSPKLEAIYEDNICDLSRFSKETFDVVLCMGAFYHIDEEARKKAMQECLRVLKKGGLLVISYINNMAVITKSIANNLENMETALHNYKAKTLDGVFLHTTPSEMENMAIEYNTTIVKHISADGMFYFNARNINCASEENFEKYMDFHLKTCEDESILGYSLHGLLFLQK